MLIRFWTMLAHCHGQIWNAAPPACSLGVSEPMVRRYLDLLLVKNGLRIGIECKRTDAPRLTPSMRTSLTDLELNRLVVIYPGTRRYSLAEGVEVPPLVELSSLM